MVDTIKIFYFYSILVFVQVFLVETLLEYRHFNLGYTTPIFGTKVKNNSTNSNPAIKNNLLDGALELADTTMGKPVEYGPTEIFPFKSILINTEKNDSKRIWIASASHAEGGRLSAKDVFPNLICSSINLDQPCEVINGSKGGMTIEDNIGLLRSYYADYEPDYAVLYQLSMVISGQQRQLTRNNGGGLSINRGIFDFSGAIKLFQSLSLYVHLTDYIGGNIKLSGPLKDSLPGEMDEDFNNQVLSFINACRVNNIKPVLVTFAASHDMTNIHKMQFSLRTNFVKYNTYLSPVGWVNMVSRYNNLLRDISISEKIPLIDLEKEMNGDFKYYIDFVHFNNKGHQKAAAYIGNELSEIISKSES